MLMLIFIRGYAPNLQHISDSRERASITSSHTSKRIDIHWNNMTYRYTLYHLNSQSHVNIENRIYSFKTPAVQRHVACDLLAQPTEETMEPARRTRGALSSGGREALMKQETQWRNDKRKKIASRIEDYDARISSLMQAHKHAQLGGAISTQAQSDQPHYFRQFWGLLLHHQPGDLSLGDIRFELNEAGATDLARPLEECERDSNFLAWLRFQPAQSDPAPEPKVPHSKLLCRRLEKPLTRFQWSNESVQHIGNSENLTIVPIRALGMPAQKIATALLVRKMGLKMHMYPLQDLSQVVAPLREMVGKL